MNLIVFMLVVFGLACAIGGGVRGELGQNSGQSLSTIKHSSMDIDEHAYVRCYVPPHCHPTESGCPKATGLIYAPVCGCDGVEYVNECVARVLNCVPFVSDGPCPFTHPTHMDVQSKCDKCVVPPVCNPGSVACPMSGKEDALVYAPVCGCNGVTYGNKCEATVLNCVPCVTEGSCLTSSYPMI